MRINQAAINLVAPVDLPKSSIFFIDAKINGALYPGKWKLIDGGLYPVDGEAFINVKAEQVVDTSALPPA